MRLFAAIVLVSGVAHAAHHAVKPKPHAKPAAAADDDDAAATKKKHPKGWPLPAAGPTATGDPELIFTFDDGPMLTTPAVLDALAAHHIHAVFFMVGDRITVKNERIPDIVKRVVHDGHVIGNHTMTHPNLCHIKDADRAAREIDDAKTTIERASRVKLAWFRTPFGVRCERVEDLLAERHLQHFHWDLDPQEWKHHSAKKAIDYVEKQLGKLQGRAVLLMHDIQPATVDALPVILDWIDEENARRLAAHKRRIRIVQSYELAAERLPAGELEWLADATPDVRGWANALAGALP